ncbi:helix-turn-helix domain-containing protein [Candidatus Kuenenbacteria bacterium]|nr:helix-turn-helix domain-containing protein [Candidatus Kuenenbacteria bacterium]
MSGFITKKIKTIQTLGERLQKHRQEKGLSPEKASRALNLNIRYIKLLEHNRYDKLPADVYTINILKSYAELLNLNPNTVVDLFKKEKELFIKTQKQKYNKKESRLYKVINHFLNPRTLKYIGIIIVLLGVLFYIGSAVNKITSPPELIVNSPAENLVTTEHQVKIQGQTEKEVNLKINGRPLLSDKQGNFSLLLDLQKGLNIIKISAQKKHSKENVIYRQVVVSEE